MAATCNRCICLHSPAQFNYCGIVQAACDNTAILFHCATWNPPYLFPVHLIQRHRKYVSCCASYGDNHHSLASYDVFAAKHVTLWPWYLIFWPWALVMYNGSFRTILSWVMMALIWPLLAMWALLMSWHVEAFNIAGFKISAPMLHIYIIHFVTAREYEV